MASDPEPTTRWGIFVGISSSLLTMAMTVYNAHTTGQITAVDEALKVRAQAFDQKIAEKNTALEESKDRTERFTFVRNLFPALANPAGSADERTLTIHLIRLALTPEEAAALFAGLKLSDSKPLQEVGAEGVASIKKERTSNEAAQRKEREGYDYLLSGNYDAAVKAFEAADDASPSYRWTEDLANLIKTRKTDLQDPAKKRDVLRLIKDTFSARVPADVSVRLKAAAGG